MFKKWFDPSKKFIKRAKIIANKIIELESSMASLKDQDFKIKTLEFKEMIKSGHDINDLIVPAFSLVREASKRVTGMTPYYVQILGAISIFEGNIAEMKTGEGKTLTAVMPAYLASLLDEGVHIVTVNDYLANREANGEIGDLFRFLGLTVGLNKRGISQSEKQEAYASDIMYTTNSELGFDYLRDNMAIYKKNIVAQRGLNYAIIDEIDSILIDEARTPLIISGGSKNNNSSYQAADRFVKSLNDEDYEIDVESKSIELTVSGMIKAEKIFKVENLYDIKYVSLVHHINNALRANYIMSKDVEYVVEENQVLIVDQFTGRILRGRQFSQGLHQALEAKEKVSIKKETITVATITYQNFFRMYKKLSGMTGTAKTEEEEFRDLYNMDVICIPTNEPLIRKDLPDYLFATEEAKFNALVNEVEKRHSNGQPILIGTIAVETSEILSLKLKKRRIPHEILNAKNHQREAEIIAKAGQSGSVTIATNMAGRGTDIKLGDGVVDLGGLAVIGSERHESRRIDNQLRGRSGRQGDPGYSRFYISGEDELLVRFGGDSFKQQLMMIEKLNSGSGEPLSSKIFTRFVEGAQKRIEGNNFDARKNVLKYDDVLRKQREVIYRERRDVLLLDSVEDKIDQALENTINLEFDLGLLNNNEISFIDIFNQFTKNYLNKNFIEEENFDELTLQEKIEYTKNLCLREISNKKNETPAQVYNEFLKVIMLRVIDVHWTNHIDTMSELRQGVTLQSYGQMNPLVIYQKEGLNLFKNLSNNISKDITKYVLRAKIERSNEREQVVKNTSTNDTSQRSTKKPRKQKIRRNRSQRGRPF